MASRDPDPRGWIRTTLWVGLAGAAVWLWINVSTGVAIIPAEKAREASPLVLRGADGARIELADFHGRVVLVNLWASWCAPCRIETTRLTRLERELGGSGLVVLGVNAEGLGPDRLRALQDDWGIEYPVGSPELPLAGGTFQGEGVIPHTWLVDREGRVRASRTGLLGEGALREAARKLLDEPERSGRSRSGAPEAGGQRPPPTV